MDGFDLEIVGRATDIEDGDTPARVPVSRVARLAHSHHMAARLIARGMSLNQVSLQTGYSYGRLASLKEDPSFRELIVHYERTEEVIQGEVEMRLLALGEDLRQHIHERLLDGELDSEPLKDVVEAPGWMRSRSGRMANVFDGQADERQSEDVQEPLSRFRPRYRALTEEEKKLHDDIKDSYLAVEQFIERLKPGRYRALAITALEESCMWAVKELTS